MLLIKVYMLPGGDAENAALLSQMTLDLLGVAMHDDPETGVKRGERIYRAQILKGVKYAGPKDGDDVRPSAVKPSKVWKSCIVRGHIPRNGRNSRGEWDLLGGALKVALDDRLDDYREGGSDE